MSEHKFEFSRPQYMALSEFNDFVAEVESSVGVKNIDLLKDIDIAMNTEESLPQYLEITQEKAEKLAKDSGVEKENFYSYLAFLYEIEYRKKYGPALWERKNGIVPCPDFLPPTSWQINSGKMCIYNVLNKTWNVLLIIILAGMLPLVWIPIAICIRPNINQGSTITEICDDVSVPYCLLATWVILLCSFVICFFASRRMRRCKNKS